MNKIFFVNKKILIISIIITLLFSFNILIKPINSYAEPDKESLQTQLSEQTQKLEEASNNYWEASQQQAEAQAAVNNAQNQIDEANKNINTNTQKLSTRATSIYRNGTGGVLDMILGCSTFKDLINVVEMLNRLNSADINLIQENKQLKEKIEEQKEILNENLQTATEKAEEAYKIKTNAEEIQSNLQSQLNQLNAEERASTLAASRGDKSSGSEQPYAPATGNAIADRALSQCGKPYIWGAVGPDGYDCSGLVSYAISGQHIRLGTAATFCGYPQVSNPQPGDICCNSGHCGIYIGGGQMVHAPQPGDVVRISGVQEGMMYTRAG